MTTSTKPSYALDRARLLREKSAEDPSLAVGLLQSQLDFVEAEDLLLTDEEVLAGVPPKLVLPDPKPR